MEAEYRGSRLSTSGNVISEYVLLSNPTIRLDSVRTIPKDLNESRGGYMDWSRVHVLIECNMIKECYTPSKPQWPIRSLQPMC